MSEKLELIAIGNAIVDVLAQTDDQFLENNKINKGAMTLIEANEAEDLYSRMGPAMEMSGGSAANTLAAFSSLGGKGAYIGKVSNDQLGKVFSHDIKAAGVHYDTPALEDGPPTARSLILVTPDAQRTMCTFLGASVWIAPSDLHQDLIERSEVLYLEGYLFDRTRAKQAFWKGAEMAHNAETKVALTLSDPFCVDRHRDEFLELVQQRIDILFCNEDELKSLYETDDFDTAVMKVKGHCEIIAITRGSKGSLIINHNESYEVGAEPVDKVIDTTGAGDLYAAGFLYGYTKKMPLPECARIGSIAASEIISHMGARPQMDLSELVAERMKKIA